MQPLDLTQSVGAISLSHQTLSENTGIRKKMHFLLDISKILWYPTFISVGVL